MPQTTINNADSGLNVRNALNTMFGELYAADAAQQDIVFGTPITASGTFPAADYGKLVVVTAASVAVTLPSATGLANGTIADLLFLGGAGTVNGQAVQDDGRAFYIVYNNAWHLIRPFAEGAGVDLAPTPFTFTDVTGATVSVTQTSNTITVAGLGTGVVAAVSITGGTYSKNGGAYTAANGFASNGDTFSVQHTASASEGTAVNTTLTIGTVSEAFTSTTAGTAAATPVVWTYSTAGRAAITNSGLTATRDATAGISNIFVSATPKKTSGDRYFEVTINNAGDATDSNALAAPGLSGTTFGEDNYSGYTVGTAALYGNGKLVYNGGVEYNNYTAAFFENAIIGVRINCATGVMSMSLNGVISPSVTITNMTEYGPLVFLGQPSEQVTLNTAGPFANQPAGTIAFGAA